MKVVKNHQTNIVEWDVVRNNLEKNIGILVEICEKVAHVFVFNFNDHGCSYAKSSYGNISWRTDLRASLLNRVDEELSRNRPTEIHYFENYADFAKAIIENGWK